MSVTHSSLVQIAGSSHGTKLVPATTTIAQNRATGIVASGDNVRLQGGAAVK